MATLNLTLSVDVDSLHHSRFLQETGNVSNTYWVFAAQGAGVFYPNGRKGPLFPGSLGLINLNISKIARENLML